MAAKRNRSGGRDTAEAESKLKRLLETETELEHMLEEAKREALEIVEAAKRDAEDRLEEFERELEAEDGGLRHRVETERDDAIREIRSAAQAEASRLKELPDAAISKIASEVIDRLLDPRGPT